MPMMTGPLLAAPRHQPDSGGRPSRHSCPRRDRLFGHQRQAGPPHNRCQNERHLHQRERLSEALARAAAEGEVREPRQPPLQFVRAAPRLEDIGTLDAPSRTLDILRSVARHDATRCHRALQKRGLSSRRVKKYRQERGGQRPLAMLGLPHLFSRRRRFIAPAHPDAEHH
jgi:hypothetical protein